MGYVPPANEEELLRAKGKNKKKAKKRQPAFKGGYVDEGKPGFHTKPVQCIDFASLYPSIMRFKNLCSSTLVKTLCAKSERMSTGYGFVRQDVFEGILPRCVRKLLVERKRIKGLMKAMDKAAPKDAEKNSIFTEEVGILSGLVRKADEFTPLRVHPPKGAPRLQRLRRAAARAQGECECDLRRAGSSDGPAVLHARRLHRDCAWEVRILSFAVAWLGRLTHSPTGSTSRPRARFARSRGSSTTWVLAKSSWTWCTATPTRS